MVEIRRRASTPTSAKLLVRLLAVGGAIFASFRCCLLFVETNSLLNAQLDGLNLFHTHADVNEKLEPLSGPIIPIENSKKLETKVGTNDHYIGSRSSEANNQKKERRNSSSGEKVDSYSAARKDEDKAIRQHGDVRGIVEDSHIQANHQEATVHAKANKNNDKKKSSRKRHFHVVDTRTGLKQQPNKSTERRIATKKKRPPFYLHGTYKFLYGPHDPRTKLIGNLKRERYKTIGPNITTWALPITLTYPTRNHDSILLESGKHSRRPIMVTLLGRFSRYIQSMDLVTGKQWTQRTKGKDPSGNALDDLNHVTAVLVDKLDNHDGRQEIWLPCGFHNDRVNHEESTNYVRIVDADTMKVRVGPKLPVAGGACISKALTIVPNEPPMICSFAGTQGNHDSGTFLPYTQCFDRIRQKWWTPFGKLPYGLDHGSLAVIPAGSCHADDPARVLIFNFRTRPYGTPHSEFLAHDIPQDGWTLEMLKTNNKKPPEKWYVYHNVTDTSLLKNVPRDASGIVMANNGRFILNFGGTYRTKKHGKSTATKKGRTSMIRSFDVCNKEWNVIGDLGLQTFALQTAASDKLNVAITCGGEAPLAYSNSPFCFVSRWNNLTVSNPQTPNVLAGGGGRGVKKRVPVVAS